MQAAIYLHALCNLKSKSKRWSKLLFLLIVCLFMMLIKSALLLKKIFSVVLYDLHVSINS